MGGGFQGLGAYRSPCPSLGRQGVGHGCVPRHDRGVEEADWHLPLTPDMPKTPQTLEDPGQAWRKTLALEPPPGLASLWWKRQEPSGPLPRHEALPGGGLKGRRGGRVLVEPLPQPPA